MFQLENCLLSEVVLSTSRKRRWIDPWCVKGFFTENHFLNILTKSNSSKLHVPLKQICSSVHLLIDHRRRQFSVYLQVKSTNEHSFSTIACNHSKFTSAYRYARALITGLMALFGLYLSTFTRHGARKRLYSHGCANSLDMVAIFDRETRFTGVLACRGRFV